MDQAWRTGARLDRRGHGEGLVAERPGLFLNHVNVDRIWQAWMRDHGAEYIPDATAPATLLGTAATIRRTRPHLRNVTPADLFGVSAFYTYDALP